jgi:hypothetical protein
MYFITGRGLRHDQRTFRITVQEFANDKFEISGGRSFCKTLAKEEIFLTVNSIASILDMDAAPGRERAFEPS